MSCFPVFKIINIGTKSFARCTCRKASCDFRLAQEVSNLIGAKPQVFSLRNQL